MKRTYMIAAAMVAFLTAGSVQAATTEAAKAKAPPPAAQAAPAPAELTSREKAGCGAVLVILGKVATSYPQLFAQKGNDGRGAQFMLEAFGAKGRMMMDEAFEDGAEQGVKPTKVYEDGLGFLFESVKPEPGESNEAAGKRAAMALLQRCTGISTN
ncbi:hypothetical protein [Caulobacter radicis]|uniref:hypothetical protein n=1 Tax=Caulobacter radicis TaxID=2172650 RepID=UPI001401EBBB|nr:hypothetical protein [Caulobacter radicis]